MDRLKFTSRDMEFGLGLESVRYAEHRMAPEFVRFARERILPTLRLDGYKLKEKRRIATHCVHNLSLAGLRKPPTLVSDGRDNSVNTLRIAVWQALVEAGLCRVWRKGIEGIPGRILGGVTRYRPTERLVALLDQYDQKKYLDLRLDFNTGRKRPSVNAHVTLHAGKTDLDTGERLPKEMQKRPLPLSTLHPLLLWYLQDKERENARCNAVMSRHEWLVRPPRGKPYEPNYCLRWTHSGKLCRYTRLVGWSAISIQLLSRRERRHLLIDGGPATELDYGQFDVRRHYHYHGLDVRGDAFRPETVLPAFHASEHASREGKAFARELVKKATLICLNCTTRGRANSAVGQFLHERPLKGSRPFMWETVFRVEKLRSGPGPAVGLVGRILRAHPRIADAFFDDRYEYTGDIMMSLGAGMMDSVRRRFANADKPACFIHDAVVCRRSDRTFGREAMESVYGTWVNCEFEPVIRVEF